MTDHPYTDADLRAEAARQHATALEDPDFAGIGEQMEGAKILSRGDFQWDQLGDDDFDTTMRGIDHLISNAADVSEWAVNLGADGLQPDPRALDAGPDNKPSFRVHFAFAPYLSDDDRADLIGQFAAFMTSGLT
jgi:hypothetical protein